MFKMVAAPVQVSWRWPALCFFVLTSLFDDILLLVVFTLNGATLDHVSFLLFPSSRKNTDQETMAIMAPKLDLSTPPPPASRHATPLPPFVRQYTFQRLSAPDL